MSGFSFAFDEVAALIALGMIAWIIYLFRRRSSLTSSNQSQPFIYFSDVTQLKTSAKGWKFLYASFPRKLEYAALFCFLIAFIDPHFFVKRENQPFPNNLPTEGIAIYLLADQSGSMSDQVSAYVNGNFEQIAKIDLLKTVTKEFIKGDPQAHLSGRPNDLIGLIAFARAAQVLSPLTFDHQIILDKLAKLQVLTTYEENGTSMGYAIYKTVNMIAATKYFAKDLVKEGKASYDIKNSIIILVTDGFQEPNPLDKGKRLRNIDLDEAAEYAKENGVRLYLINVDPSIATEDLAPQRHLLEKITKLTDGKFYIVQGDKTLDSVYADIDRIERSRLPNLEGEILSYPKSELPQYYRRVSFYPFFIACGMLCLLAAICLNTTYLRKVP